MPKAKTYESRILYSYSVMLMEDVVERLVFRVPFVGCCLLDELRLALEEDRSHKTRDIGGEGLWVFANHPISKAKHESTARLPVPESGIRKGRAGRKSSSGRERT